jgi:prepilin-type N-terminal cleavage/methylation domain-containing protein
LLNRCLWYNYIRPLIIDEWPKAAYSYPKKRSGVKKLKQNQKGFTLIELLVVIAIIGLLASVVLLALNSARAKARDARRLSDLRQISTAAQMEYDSTGEYPATANDFDTSMPGGFPTQPASNVTGCTHSDTYGYTGTATTFDAYACLEQGTSDFEGPGRVNIDETGALVRP